MFTSFKRMEGIKKTQKMGDSHHTTEQKALLFCVMFAGMSKSLWINIQLNEKKPLLISERYTFQVSVCCIKTVTLSAYFAPGKIPTTLQTSKTEKTHKTENRFC